MKKLMPFIFLVGIVLLVNNKLGGNVDTLIGNVQVAFDFVLASIVGGSVLGLLMFKEIRKKGIFKSAVIFGAVVVFMSVYIQS